MAEEEPTLVPPEVTLDVIVPQEVPPDVFLEAPDTDLVLLVAPEDVAPVLTPIDEEIIVLRPDPGEPGARGPAGADGAPGAPGATTHAGLPDVTPNQHHNQVHAIDGADHTGVLVDGQIPAAIARDTEVTAAVDTHTGLPNAHHTQVHAIDSSNHTGVLADAQIPSAIARDSEVTAEIAAHAALPNAHHNKAHAADHAENGIDELVIEALGTAELALTSVLRPDGLGGVEWVDPSVLDTDPNAHFHVSEDQTANTNGTTTVFNLGFSMEVDSSAVYLNGLRLRPVTDYTEGTSSITMGTAPATGDQLIIDYRAIEVLSWFGNWMGRWFGKWWFGRTL